MSRRVTIVDVAKVCGVTPATVSRALNTRTQSSISQALRQKILAKAQEMGYVPNLAARNLVRHETHIVGVFASPYTHIAEGINEPLLEGFRSVLHTAGYDMFFEMSSLDDSVPPVPFWRFDGALLMQEPKPETVAELDRRGVPYVCVNEKVGNAHAYVLADDVLGMNRALDYLRKLGHKRIAYTQKGHGYFRHYSETERYETLVAGVEKHHMELVLGHDGPFRQPMDFLNLTVKANRVTAIISYDHRIAVQLVGAASTMGLRIPQDFSLICFNDVFPVSMLAPPLTAVAVSGREMGRIGADLLLKRLESKQPQVGEVRVPEELVIRSSTAPPPELQ